MKIIKGVLICLVFLVAIIAYPSYLLVNSYANDNSMKSPLPDINSDISSVLGISSFWRPTTGDVDSVASEPRITARGAISYDLTTDTLIYGKDIDRRMPMASITKIMTAVIALETSPIESEYIVSAKAAAIGENSMGLTKGEILTLEELLYGLILKSGNDAAEVIAEGSPFGRDNFIYLMNKKAEDMGLANTRFSNPSGLEGDGAQYSTPYDLVVITKYALENPIFAEIAATVSKELLATNKHKYFYMFNDTNLLTSYPGVRGVKTGYTYEAGLCLVTYLEYEDRKIIAVLLNSQNRRQEMKDLLDYSLKSLGIKPPKHE